MSDLQGVILEEIISLLPTKDCCHTQVLSTRWCPLWCTAPLNLDCRQISVLPEFDLIRAIVSSHQQGPVQCLCIPTSYLLSIPGKVDAWLTSPEFGKLQQFEFYHYHESFIPRTYQEFVPTPPLSISRFSSSLHTTTFARCHLPDDLVQMLRLPLLKKTFACGGLSVGGLTAQHHPLQLPCPGALADCFGNRNRYQLSPNKVASP